MLNKMIKFYNAKSFTHNYIFGFQYKGNVYEITTDAEILPAILKVDKASRGNGMSLRFRPNNAIKQMLIDLGAEKFCSVDEMNESIKAMKGNKGEWYEKYETEKVGQEWHKDSVPFWEDGDLTVNGIAYQIKFESATFINEKTMARLG